VQEGQQQQQQQQQQRQQQQPANNPAEPEAEAQVAVQQQQQQHASVPTPVAAAEQVPAGQAMPEAVQGTGHEAVSQAAVSESKPVVEQAVPAAHVPVPQLLEQQQAAQQKAPVKQQRAGGIEELLSQARNGLKGMTPGWLPPSVGDALHQFLQSVTKRL
jgi:hypothetical protein